MTNQEFLNRLIRLEEEKKRQIRRIEDQFVSDREKLFAAYAEANARFRKSDVIIENHPQYGPVGFTIIRVESYETVNEGTTTYIKYRGRALHSDFTGHNTIYGEPMYETIYDRGDKKVKLLKEPLHVSFVVVTSGGREIPAKTARESIEAARTVLTTTDDSIVRYGVTASGKREQIQRIANVNKYFKKNK